MTLSLADRSNKAQKVKVLPIAGKDPDAQRSEMIKVTDDLICSTRSFLPLHLRGCHTMQVDKVTFILCYSIFL